MGRDAGDELRHRGPTNLERVTIQNNNPVGLSCSDPIEWNGRAWHMNNTSVNVATSCGDHRVLARGPRLRRAVGVREPMPAESFPQRFGPYVLLIRVLGVGGMGDVYLASGGKPGMERPCVVKRLAQHATSEDGERFRREANLARKLSHGAIAQTLAVDEIDGELIIAQEFLHGCSLSGLLATCLRQRERLPVAVVVHVAREIARALAYAHEQGVTHRDIAPDNVILTYSWRSPLARLRYCEDVDRFAPHTAGMVGGP